MVLSHRLSQRNHPDGLFYPLTLPLQVHWGLRRPNEKSVCIWSHLDVRNVLTCVPIWSAFILHRLPPVGPVSLSFSCLSIRSGLAGVFSKDKTLSEEYEKADLKVTAGQGMGGGGGVQEPCYHGYVATFRKAPPLCTLCQTEQETKYHNLTKSQREGPAPNIDE